MHQGFSIKNTSVKLLILLGLLLSFSCKTPSILVTEEQRTGDEYSNQHDYETAIVHYRNSLAQSRKLGVYRNLEVEADICRKISYAFSVQGKYPEALEYAHYAYSRDSMLQNQLGIIEDFREMGKVKLYMGEFKQGTAYLDSVVLLSEGLESSIKSTKLISLADTYLTLSRVNAVLGHFKKAELETKAALNIYEQLNNETGEMECMLQMGQITNETGRPWQSEVYAKNAEKLAQKLELNSTRHLHLLANIAEGNADYQKAIQLRLAAIEEAKRVNILPSIVWTTMVCGDTYGLVGDSEKAEAYYQEAISLQDTLNIESRALEASAALRTGSAGEAASYFSEIGSSLSLGLAYLKLGDLMLERRNYPFAKRQYSKALNEFTNSESMEGVAKAHLKIADCSMNMGNTTDSYTSLEEARSNTRQPETLWQIEYVLGQVEEKTGNKDKAVDAYKKSIEIIEEIRGKFTIDELKSVYINDKIKVYDRLINLLMENGEENEAFNYSERARARAFLDMIGNKKINIKAGENQELANMEQDLRLQMMALSKMLHQEELGTGRGLNRSALESDLISTRSKYSDLLHRIKLETPEYASLITVAPPELSHLQELATKNKAYLVYWIGEQRSFVWIVKSDKIISKEIPATEDDMIEITSECRNAVRRNTGFSGNIRTMSSQCILTLKHGYRMLIAPIEEELSKIETIGIIPHKVLHLLPFQALMSAQNEFLMEKIKLYYTPSLATLHAMLDRPAPAGEQMLAMALGDLALSGFSGLPGTKKEVENLSVLQPELTSLYDMQSTETYFKEHASEYAHIHLATHGFMDEEQPLFSFVLFNPTEEDDGYLTVSEIFDLSLNAELVVLSACQTGLGELSEGDEIIGLSRAIIYAGSDNVIVSLWSVADEQTAYLMTEFYKFQQNTSTIEALQLAQKATFEKYRNPLYWAPFKLIGRGN